jgi:hypothetical protein
MTTRSFSTIWKDIKFDAALIVLPMPYQRINDESHIKACAKWDASLYMVTDCATKHFWTAKLCPCASGIASRDNSISDLPGKTQHFGRLSHGLSPMTIYSSCQ